MSEDRRGLNGSLSGWLATLGKATVVGDVWPCSLWDPCPLPIELRPLMQALSFWGKDLELVSRIYHGRGWSMRKAQVLNPRGKACCWATREPVLSSLFSWQSLPEPCVPVVCGTSGLSPSAGTEPPEPPRWAEAVDLGADNFLWTLERLWRFG